METPEDVRGCGDAVDDVLAEFSFIPPLASVRVLFSKLLDLMMVLGLDLDLSLISGFGGRISPFLNFDAELQLEIQ